MRGSWITFAFVPGAPAWATTPLVDGLGGGLYEVRSTQRQKEYRVFFCIDASTIVLLHRIVKKTRTTRRADLELARKRLREVVAG